MDNELYHGIKSLEAITKKHDLIAYYHKCCSKIPLPEYNTQFEHDYWTTLANEVITSLVYDYALFDEDNTHILKDINLDDELLNCCSPYRL